MPPLVLSGECWNDQAGAVTDEIALNQAHFATRSTEEALSPLAHAMVYLWQHRWGTPSYGTYHTKHRQRRWTSWAVCPSHPGAPGGTRTGQHRSHDVVAGGLFAQACTELLAEGFVISRRERVRAQVPGKGKTEGKAGVRTTYTCPDCGRNAWAKADVVLLCGACEVAL
jgi:hypothetical protein